MYNRYLPIVFLMISVIFSCTRPPDYPNEPVIETIGYENTIAVQGGGGLSGDYINMTISFTDGDGDMGGIGQDTSRVYILDPRYTAPAGIERIAFPMVPELGTGNGISGEASFRFSPGCCFFPGQASTNCEPLVDLGYPQDTVTFLIYITDRNGNKSNVIETVPIILLCE